MSRYRHPTGRDGWTLRPRRTERFLLRTASDKACPEPRLLDYPDPIGPSYDAYCDGSPLDDGFYGEGIVDALAAVTARGPRRY